MGEEDSPSTTGEISTGIGVSITVETVKLEEWVFGMTLILIYIQISVKGNLVHKVICRDRAINLVQVYFFMFWREVLSDINILLRCKSGAVRGGHYAGSRGASFAGPSRPYQYRAWYGMPDGGSSEPVPPRRTYSPGGQFDMPFMGRHFDDPYLYDDNIHGMKRPFYMTVRFLFFWFCLLMWLYLLFFLLILFTTGRY